MDFRYGDEMLIRNREPGREKLFDFPLFFNRIHCNTNCVKIVFRNTFGFELTLGTDRRY